MEGKIKKLIRGRGYGFISAENEEDVFFHRSALDGIEFDALEEGNSVKFDLENGQKGTKAVNIVIIDIDQ